MPTLNIRNNKAPLVRGREAKLPGSNERIVANNGEINASSQKDLLKNIGYLLTQASLGNIDVANDVDEKVEISAAEKVECIKAAYDNYQTSPVWAEMGHEIAADVNISVQREGFMRNLLEKNEISGRVAMIRTRVNEVTAVYMTTPSNLAPQYVNSHWTTFPEFNITTNVLVSGDDILVDGDEILQEQYDYSLQSFMVAEDRMWKIMADAIVGTTIPLQIFTGTYGPDDLINMYQLLVNAGTTPDKVLMHNNYWSYMIQTGAFSNWFDPATKYQMIQTGQIGSLLGLTFMTDGFRQQNMQVLQPGEIYVIAKPEQHGGYTERGPIMAVPTDGYNNGVDARGWFMKERLAIAIVNPYSVVKGRRI